MALASKPYVGRVVDSLVLSLAQRGFSPGTPVFPFPQKPTLPNFNSIWNARTRFNETPKCFVVNNSYNYNVHTFIGRVRLTVLQNEKNGINSRNHLF